MRKVGIDGKQTTSTLAEAPLALGQDGSERTDEEEEGRKVEDMFMMMILCTYTSVMQRTSEISKYGASESKNEKLTAHENKKSVSFFFHRTPPKTSEASPCRSRELGYGGEGHG